MVCSFALSGFDTDCELVSSAKDFAAAATGSADTDVHRNFA